MKTFCYVLSTLALILAVWDLASHNLPRATFNLGLAIFTRMLAHEYERFGALIPSNSRV